MTNFSDYSFVTSDINATNGSVAVWDGRTGANLMVLKGSKLSKNSMTVLDDIVVGCVDGKSLLEIWKLNNQGKKKIIPLPSPGKAVQYSSKLNILACFLGSEVYMWQPYTGKLLKILRNVHSSQGSAIIFLLTGRIITIDDSGLIAAWDIELSECLWKCRPFGVTTVYACALKSLNDLAVVAENGKMIILSLLDGSSLSDMIDIGLNVNCILYHNYHIFFGCNKGIVASLDILEMTVREMPIKSSIEMDHDITQLALTPDKSGLVIVVDGVTALTMSLSDFQIRSTRFIQFGSQLNCLKIVNKTADMFISLNTDSRILIERLEFTFETPIRPITTKIERMKTFDEYLNLLDYFVLMDNIRNKKTEDENKRINTVKTILNILDT